MACGRSAALEIQDTEWKLQGFSEANAKLRDSPNLWGHQMKPHRFSTTLAGVVTPLALAIQTDFSTIQTTKQQG
jgi:hypothetical protein